MGPPCVCVVADDAAVAAPLEPVDRPLVHLVADRRLREEDEAVVRDIEVVGEAQAAVVVDRPQAAVGFVCRLLDGAVGRDAIEAHAADADIEIVFAVERHAERLAADMGEDFHCLVVGREKSDDISVARAGVKIVVPIENDVLRRFDSAQSDQRHVTQLVVLLEWAAFADLGGRRRRQLVEGRTDIDLADDAGAVLLPANVDRRGDKQNARQRHAVEAAARVHGREAVGDEQDNQRADRRLGD